MLCSPQPMSLEGYGVRHGSERAPWTLPRCLLPGRTWLPLLRALHRPVREAALEGLWGGRVLRCCCRVCLSPAPQALRGPWQGWLGGKVTALLEPCGSMVLSLSCGQVPPLTPPRPLTSSSSAPVPSTKGWCPPGKRNSLLSWLAGNRHAGEVDTATCRPSHALQPH